MQILMRGGWPIVAMFMALVALSGCSQSTSGISQSFNSVKSMVVPTSTQRYRASDRERECLARAMFFESNRSSRDGLIAVGSVVMNRRDSGKWGNNICDVVGAKRQFAPGVLTRPMNSKALPDVLEAADAVLKGERHAKVTDDVMFFHTAGLKFPYKNMRYTTVAGGNAFYYKANRKNDRLPKSRQDQIPGIEPMMVAQADTSASDAEVSLPDQIAYVGDTPATMIGAPRERVEPRAETRSALAAEDAPQIRSPQKVKRSSQARETQMIADADFAYEVPSSERFGGDAMPAYADSGLSEGDGTGMGVLGRMMVLGNN